MKPKKVARKPGWAGKKEKTKVKYPPVDEMVRQIRDCGYRPRPTDLSASPVRFEVLSPGGAVIACTSTEYVKAVASVWRAVVSTRANKASGMIEGVL